jgi:hypothetical protein
MADAPAVPEEKPVVADAPVVEQPVVAAEPVVVEQPVVETPLVEEKPVESAPERTPSLLEAAEAPGQKDAEKAVEGDQPTAVKAEEKPAEPPKTGDQPATEKPPEQKAEEKPAEAKKDGEAPAEEKPAEKPALEAIEYEYTVPETITMDDARRGQFKEALDGFRADPRAGVQKLLDLHSEVMAGHDKALRQQQYDVFNQTKADWRKQVTEDELIGGAGHRTAMQQIATVRNAFVSDAPFGSKQYKADMAEFVHALDSTGAGDHPAILRMLYRIGSRLNEPAAPHVIDFKPPADAARRKGGGVLYDNDRSPTDRN